MKTATRLVSLCLCTLGAASYSLPPIEKDLTPTSESSHQSLSRRQFVLKSVASVGTVTPFILNPSLAYAEDNLMQYQDTDCNFAIDIPSGWEKSVRSLPDRRKIVLFIKPGSEQRTLLFLAYTPVRSDFTSLGSFGSVDQVAQATILPKSSIAGVNDVESKMLSAESRKQAYVFDYVTKVPKQPETHFRTIFSLAQGAVGGAGNVLVSITAQTPESEYQAMQPLFDKIVASYK